MIDISHMTKAEALSRLYNAARPQGMGFLHFRSGLMSLEEAQGMLDAGYTYFDYVHGRVMKVDLSGDSLDPRLYDHDNGIGAAFRALTCIIP